MASLDSHIEVVGAVSAKSSPLCPPCLCLRQAPSDVELESLVGTHLENQVLPGTETVGLSVANVTKRRSWNPSNAIRALAVLLYFMVRHHRMRMGSTPAYALFSP